MDFEYSDKVKELMARVDGFMQEHIFPAEAAFDEFVEDPANLWVVPPLIEELKQKAKEQGLWNLFLPKEYEEFSPGLTNLEYAPLAELMGRNEWASEIFNCSAPDTGNMEVFARYGTPEQKEKWLKPLLAGDIRSAFLMTEPQNACSDATNVECSIVRDGDEYVINGRKWWSSAVYDPRCEIFLVMGKTDPTAAKYIQQSTIVIPKNTPGVRLVRPLKVFNALHSPGGHGEVALENVRVPVSNIILGEGRGFEIAQGRLGPGRIHHCMRLIGAAQRCLDLMCKRVDSRVAFGKKLSEQGSIRQEVAKSRCEIEQARLLTLSTADKLDKFGNKEAKDLIAMIKIVAPRMCQEVADRAMQAHGGMGLSQDTPIANLFAYARFVRMADGPDEVHMAQLGKTTIKAAVEEG
ncbi:(R)-benzylsuccinyl-CoA dehydrogenase [Zhongshania aliphaticivorans]|uniref:(R)-benzylsuccinyl-CoA dehydrogenase n=1 Tax=Zhongshania aliphaticivorans TaxID=1470434 RepID=A0A5S9Q2E2_9GAMM|nr:acyl-CoA dehydrogenase family protein [Zhongshania aliphaticivorans]CAA0093439.1 (R)-benzylsuccinyl-CoA dehydrogenase [Zhongshania aliphaticivorans]CAA0111359.1 (R)-benzylsuccinyl-CoA dehydrogenase [Zhongshania aliphaticivorans]